MLDAFEFQAAVKNQIQLEESNCKKKDSCLLIEVDNRLGFIHFETLRNTIFPDP